MLLRLARNACQRNELDYLTGMFAEEHSYDGWFPVSWTESGLEGVIDNFIPELTCQLAAPVVPLVDWATQQQRVLPPQQAHSLLLQLLQGRRSRQLLVLQVVATSSTSTWSGGSGAAV
jgi:hypothetical protein